MDRLEIQVTFKPQSKRIEVQVDPFTVVADGGDRSDPSPGMLFLCGLAACTASTARSFCLRNGLPLPLGMSVSLVWNNETNLVESVESELHLPPDFPADRREDVEIAAGRCTVKKWWSHPPEFKVSTQIIP